MAAIAVVSGIVAGVMVMNKPTQVSELESASKSTDSSLPIILLPEIEFRTMR